MTLDNPRPRGSASSGRAALAIVLCAAALAGCSLLDPAAKVSPLEPLGDAARGRGMAQAQCSACHAISGPGPSPRTQAPPFSQIADRYADLRLDWELEAISQVGHYAMPAKPLAPAQIRDLDAYLRSLPPARSTGTPRR
jgi:mono/diheme cytochrome c family protein